MAQPIDPTRTTGIHTRLRQAKPGAYYFTLSSGLQRMAATPADARNPRGARFQVAFENGVVETRADDYKDTWKHELLKFEREDLPYDDKRDFDVTVPTGARALPWNGLGGTVLSGSDFFLLRLDGMLELNGRLTIRAEPDECLIDMVYSGIVDLNAHVAKTSSTKPKGDANDDKLTEAKVSQVFVDFVSGKLSLRASTIPVQLTTTFEVATGPWSKTEGEDTTWIEDRYLERQRFVWRYEALARKQFVAVGDLHFATAGPLPAATGLDVAVLDLEALTREVRW